MGNRISTADRIAKNLGFDEKSPQRAAAGTMFVLQTVEDEGHVFYSYDDLMKKSKEMLNSDESVLEEARRFVLC